jgi:asparagine synthase (glutamine-hydrolysing)
VCGIAGIINSRLDRDELEMRLQKLQRALHHRGPDDHGLFISKDNVAGLVSTRLAILDLSDAGHQPMQSPDGRYTIVFNGEIYNYGALRSELLDEGHSFKSNSDTKVVLRMFMLYGADAVREFEGMFVLAIWDDREQSLFLARGPLGIKPLYFARQNHQLLFASEIRALLKTELLSRQICREAAASYLLFGAVQEPLTLVDGIEALPGGHYLFWRAGEISLTKFGDVQFSDDPISHDDAVGMVRAAFEETIDRHLVSDVPVGIFLSGGVDSTAIVALAAQKQERDLRTFSISFDDPRFDEGEAAKRTAAHFRTEHCDWRLDSATAKGLLAKFLESSDQPSIDGFNTFCVSKLAHDQGLKVVLSGLGGDEIFGGYQSFELVPRMVRFSRALNLGWPLRAGAGKLLERIASPPIRRVGRFLDDFPTMSAGYWAMRGIFTPGETAKLLAHYGLTSEGPNGHFQSPLQSYVPPQPTMEDEVSYLEITRYMRNQLLRDSDVMSMAWSLELRVPFVDRKFIETVARIPASLRLARGKQILFDAAPEIPEWVRNRPKQGFTFPFEDWVTSEWRDIFQRIEAQSPVRLKNWYRTWCLFALENFLERNGMEIGETLRS